MRRGHMGPDRYVPDISPGADVERGGWKSIRIRGSVFYANRTNAIWELADAIPPTARRLPSWTMKRFREIGFKTCRERTASNALGTHAVDSADENIVEQPTCSPRSRRDR